MRILQDYFGITCKERNGNGYHISSLELAKSHRDLCLIYMHTVKEIASAVD